MLDHWSVVPLVLVATRYTAERSGPEAAELVSKKVRSVGNQLELFIEPHTPRSSLSRSSLDTVTCFTSVSSRAT